MTDKYEEFITLHKDKAKQWYKGSHVEQLNEYAHEVHGMDWQKFTYFVKQRMEIIPHLPFNNREWNYLYDMLNGFVSPFYEVTRPGATGELNYLHWTVLEANKYDHLGEKWFDGLDEFGQFVDKVSKLNEEQLQATIIETLRFWKSTINQNNFFPTARAIANN